MPLSKITSGDDADPAWTGTARFLDGRVPQGLRVIAPESFASLLGPLASPEAGPLPDWAVVRLAESEALPPGMLQRLLAETTPVYANDGYVVFSRRPTFGLADMRNAAPVRALADRSAAGPASPPAAAPLPAAEPAPAPSYLAASVPKASEPPEAAQTPLLAPRSPEIPRATLPPEALAFRVPAPTARPLPAPEAGARPALPGSLPPQHDPSPRPEPSPAASEPRTVPSPASPTAVPPPSVPASESGWGGLPARIAALLGGAAGMRVAALNGASLGQDSGAMELAVAALPSVMLSDAADHLPEACFDAALLLPDSGSLAADVAEAARLLRPGGLVLLVAENTASLGRRLAAALGRPVMPAGLGATVIRGALHAAGLTPLRLEGHSIDAWRATSDTAPDGLAPSQPAAALLEEAGEAAGPQHAAWLLLLARKR